MDISAAIKIYEKSLCNLDSETDSAHHIITVKNKNRTENFKITVNKSHENSGVIADSIKNKILQLVSHENITEKQIRAELVAILGEKGASLVNITTEKVRSYTTPIKNPEEKASKLFNNICNSIRENKPLDENTMKQLSKVEKFLNPSEVEKALLNLTSGQLSRLAESAQNNKCFILSDLVKSQVREKYRQKASKLILDICDSIQSHRPSDTEKLIKRLKKTESHLAGGFKTNNDITKRLAYLKDDERSQLVYYSKYHECSLLPQVLSEEQQPHLYFDVGEDEEGSDVEQPHLYFDVHEGEGSDVDEPEQPHLYFDVHESEGSDVDEPEQTHFHLSHQAEHESPTSTTPSPVEKPDIRQTMKMYKKTQSDGAKRR